MNGVNDSSRRDVMEFTLNPFIRIDANGTVTMVVNRSEMGQGVHTSLPMPLAEELECDWTKVRVEPASVASVHNNPITGLQMTGGSMSIHTEWERLRTFGAAAREMLIAAAAEIWGVEDSGDARGRGLHRPQHREPRPGRGAGYASDRPGRNECRLRGDGQTDQASAHQSPIRSAAPMMTDGGKYGLDHKFKSS